MLAPFLFVSCLAAADWPQFRGLDSNGHVTHSQGPLEWSETKNILWKIPIPGLGWSSPVIVNDRLYLTTAVPQGEGLSLRAMALNAQSGKMIWDREIRAVAKAPSIHVKNSHASPTPIVRDGSVFVHFGALGTARLDASDGKIQWLCTELDYPPLHGSGGSPILAEGKLAVVCDGSKNPFVAAIDATTGKIAWKTPRSIQPKISHSFVTPLVATIDGKTQILAPGPDHFAAYDLNTGAELWKVKAPGWSVVPQPTLAFGLVIYNHDYDNPELMAVKVGGNQGDVTETKVAWRLKKGAPSTPTPLLIGEELYFVSDKGIASCLDVKTGTVHWSERLEGTYSASPLYVNERILFLNETGVATWMKPGKAFAPLGKNRVNGRTLATPAFDKGALFLRTDEHLYKFGEKGT